MEINQIGSDVDNFLIVIVTNAIPIQKIKGMKERPKSLTIEEIAKPWKPYRSVAALLLWSTHDKD